MTSLLRKIGFGFGALVRLVVSLKFFFAMASSSDFGLGSSYRFEYRLGPLNFLTLDFCNILSSSSIKNCLLLEKDVTAAQDIFGEKVQSSYSNHKKPI